MNILVTGANGQLGNEMRIVARGSADRYFFTDVCDACQESVSMLHKLAGDDVCTETSRLDITDLAAIHAFVEQNQIQVIINCAAYTNVDAAESNQELAMLLNAKAPENLAVAMKEANGLLVHISTDYVFGKEPYNIPCTEEQQGTPTGVYGYTKLCGEQNIKAVGCQHVIIRTAWLYSEFGKNFCKTMLNLTASKPQLKVVFDQAGTPTYAYDLAKAIAVILKDYNKEILSSQFSILNYSKTGVYHFSNEGVCSWYDFTKMIQEYAGQKICDVQPCHSSEFPSPVTRPSYSVLDKTKIKQTFSVAIPYWTDSLRLCISYLK
ncbi:MAG: dTDP-4-dehydrorhamnose reductase [Bacteroidaceae bacterium]|nr:dTDP-4-dehydrorhamnose reductase [Bacteroidaceae bacterium]